MHFHWMWPVVSIDNADSSAVQGEPPLCTALVSALVHGKRRGCKSGIEMHGVLPENALYQVVQYTNALKRCKVLLLKRSLAIHCRTFVS